MLTLKFGVQTTLWPTLALVFERYDCQRQRNKNKEGKQQGVLL